MKTYNTSEILKAAHNKTSYEYRMSRGRSFYYSSMSYRQIFAIMLKKQWESAKDAAKRATEVAKTYTIKLAYAEHDLRGSVKKLGGKWDADSKTWSVKCKWSDLGKLQSKVVDSMEVAYRELVNMVRTGYDYIEM